MCPIDASEPANGHSVPDAHTSPPNAPDAILPLTLPPLVASAVSCSSSSLSRCSSSLPVSPSLAVCRRRLRAVLAVPAVAAAAEPVVVSVDVALAVARLAAAAVCGCARRDREEFVSLPMF